MRKLAAIALMLLLSPVASASYMAGRIGLITVLGNGLVFVDISEKNIYTPRTNIPACATYGARFVFDATTPEGKVLYDLMMTASKTQARIGVGGTGTCMTPGYEFVDYFVLWPSTAVYP